MTLRADHGLSVPPPPPAPATHHHTHRGTFNPDMIAAFMGLIGGSIALLVLVFIVVKLTAASFEGHDAGAAPGAAQHGAAESHAPAPAAPAPTAPPAGTGAAPAPQPGAPATATPPAGGGTAAPPASPLH